MPVGKYLTKEHWDMLNAAEKRLADETADILRRLSNCKVDCKEPNEYVRALQEEISDIKREFFGGT